MSNTKEIGTTENCKEAVPTESTESINKTNFTAANVTESMDVGDNAVAGTSTSATTQATESETETKDASNGLDEISDEEMLNEQPGMVSHGNLTDLEDVSMDESDDNTTNNFDNLDILDTILAVDDKKLSEAVKSFLGEDDNVQNQPNTTGSSEIEKNLALFDDGRC